MVAFTFTKLDGSSRTIDEETLKKTSEVVLILQDEFLKLLGDKDIRVSKGKSFVSNFFDSYMEWGESTESDSDRKQLRRDISKAYFEALSQTKFRDLILKPDFKGGLDVVLEIAKGKKSERYFDEELDSLLTDEYKRKVMDLIDAYDRSPETLLENAKWRNRAAKSYNKKTEEILTKKYIYNKIMGDMGKPRFKPDKGRIDPLMVVKFRDKDGSVRSIDFEPATELDKKKIDLFGDEDVKRLIKKKIEAFNDASEFYEHEEVVLSKPKTDKLKNMPEDGLLVSYEGSYDETDLFNDLKRLREEEYANANTIKIPIFGVPKLLGEETTIELREKIVDMIIKSYNTLLADVSSHTNDIQNMNFQIRLGGKLKNVDSTLFTGLSGTPEFKRITLEEAIEGADIEEAKEESKTKSVKLQRVRKGDKKAKEYLQKIAKESDELIKSVETKIEGLDIDKKYLSLDRVNSLLKQIKTLADRAKTNAKKEDLLEEDDLEVLYTYGKLQAILNKGLPDVEKAIKEIYKKEGLTSVKLILDSVEDDAKKEAEKKKLKKKKEIQDFIKKKLKEKEEDIRFKLSSALKPALNYDVKRKSLVENLAREGITPTEASARLSLTPEEYSKISVKNYKARNVIVNKKGERKNTWTESEAKEIEEEAKKQQERRLYYKDDYFEDADKIKNKILREDKTNNVLAFNISLADDAILQKIIFIVDSRTGKERTKVYSLVDKANNIFIVPKKDLVRDAKREIGDIIFEKIKVGEGEEEKEVERTKGGSVINVVLSGVGSLPFDLAEGEVNKTTLSNILSTPNKPLNSRTITIPKDATRKEFEQMLDGKTSLRGSTGISEGGEEEEEVKEETTIDLMFTIMGDKVERYTIEPKKSDVGTYREEFDSVETDKEGKEKKRVRVKGRVKTTLNAEARKKADRQVDDAIGFITLLLNKFRITRRA